jgi:hypothetical protein
MKVSGPAGVWTSTPIPAQGYVLMSMILDKSGDYELVSKDVKVSGKILVVDPAPPGVKVPTPTTTAQ